MSRRRKRSLTVLAPAKINLYLHVTGRLDNGYHTLDSLVSFIDVGDQVVIEAADDFSFRIQGPYASSFVAGERDFSPDSSNILVQAVWAYARSVKKEPQFRITLVKNLPLASGLGGGSADAAAVIWGLAEWWGAGTQQPAAMLPLLTSLGADVPVCMACKASHVQGIGDIVQPVSPMPDIATVLVNPGASCSTREVFSTYTGTFKQSEAIPDELDDFDEFITFLAGKNNDLALTGIEIVPEISHVLQALGEQEGCRLSRMSGSGATCFGLFKDEYMAQLAAENILQNNPGWWVRNGILNRPERY